MHLDKLHLHICLHFATMMSQTAMTEALKWSFQAKNDREFSTFFFFLVYWIWLGGRSVQSPTVLQNWQWEAECCTMSVLLKHNWSSVPRWLGAKWKIPILHRFVIKVDKTFIVQRSCNHIYQNKLSVIDLHGASDWRKITLTLVPIPELIKGGEKEIDSEHLGPTLDD